MLRVLWKHQYFQLVTEDTFSPKHESIFKKKKLRSIYVFEYGLHIQILSLRFRTTQVFSNSLTELRVSSYCGNFKLVFSSRTLLTSLKHSKHLQVFLDYFINFHFSVFWSLVHSHSLRTKGVSNHDPNKFDCIKWKIFKSIMPQILSI